MAAPMSIPQSVGRVIPKLSFGCPVLDTTFGGGVLCKGITEFVSESGVGKTQIALQMLVAAVRTDHEGAMEGASIYLHTESPFPFRRLQQYVSNMDRLPVDVMDRIFIQKVSSVDHLIDILLRINVHIETKKIKLVVIDSMAALFRGVFSNSTAELNTRQTYLYKIGYLLGDLSRKYSLGVVVTNQVVDVFSTHSSSRKIQQPCFITSGRKVIPALGLCWGSCLNARFFLSKEIISVESTDNATSTSRTKREIQLVFSTYIPKMSACEFTITTERVAGICGM